MPFIFTIAPASSRACSAVSTPARSMPVSTSISTPTVLPTARAARAIRAAFSASSTATITSASRASAAIVASFSGPSTVLTMKMLSRPERTITTASHTVAVEMPIAPAPTCMRASSGLLCTLMCGRIFAGRSFRRFAIFSMLRRAACRSRISAGVMTSLRRLPMAWA